MELTEPMHNNHPVIIRRTHSSTSKLGVLLEITHHV